MLKNAKLCLLVVLLVSCALFQETEARRKILRGRKAVNRQYLRPLGLPSWAIVILVGLGQLCLGAVIFVLLKVAILDRSLKPAYMAAPMTPPEERNVA